MSNETKKYSTIDMPMRVFINAKCDGDMSEVENFDDVWFQYIESISGKELQLKIKDEKEKELLKGKILLAQLAINILSLKSFTSEDEPRRKEVFEILKGLNFHALIPAPDLDDIEKYCEQIEGHIKLAVINLMEMENEEKDKKKKKNASPEIVYTRDMFADNMLEIQSALNIRITEDDSVRMYCRAIVRHAEYRLNLQQKNNKKRI